MRISDWSSDVCSSDLASASAATKLGSTGVAEADIAEMNYDKFFTESPADLRSEGRYRIFADPERVAASFPRAMRHRADTREGATVCCSHDYPGMAQHPQVPAAMPEARPACGHRPAG